MQCGKHGEGLEGRFPAGAARGARETLVPVRVWVCDTSVYRVTVTVCVAVTGVSVCED